MARLISRLTARSVARLQGIGRRGSTLIESAFIIPLMLSLIFGAIEFGTLLHMRHTMLHAAREGARALAVQGSSVGQAVDDINALLPGEDFDYEVNVSVPPAESLDRDVVVEISVPYTQASLGDMFGFWGDDRMVVEVTMRSEQ